MNRRRRQAGDYHDYGQSGGWSYTGADMIDPSGRQVYGRYRVDSGWRVRWEIRQYGSDPKLDPNIDSGWASSGQEARDAIEAYFSTCRRIEGRHRQAVGEQVDSMKIEGRVLVKGQIVKIKGEPGSFRILWFTPSEGSAGSVTVAGGGKGYNTTRTFYVDRIGRRPRAENAEEGYSAFAQRHEASDYNIYLNGNFVEGPMPSSAATQYLLDHGVDPVAGMRASGYTVERIVGGRRRQAAEACYACGQPATGTRTIAWDDIRPACDYHADAAATQRHDEWRRSISRRRQAVPQKGDFPPAALMQMTQGQVEDQYRRGGVSQDEWEAYMHVWQTSVTRMSDLGAGYSAPPTEPAVIALVEEMRSYLPSGS